MGLPLSFAMSSRASAAGAAPVARRHSWQAHPDQAHAHPMHAYKEFHGHPLSHPHAHAHAHPGEVYHHHNPEHRPNRHFGRAAPRSSAMTDQPEFTKTLRKELERLKAGPHSADVHMLSFPITEFPEYGIGLELLWQDCAVEEFPDFSRMTNEVWSEIVRATGLPPAIFMPRVAATLDEDHKCHTAVMSHLPNQIFLCSGVIGAMLRVLHQNPHVNREYLDTCATLDKNETRMQNIASWAGSDLALYATKEDVESGRITHIDAPTILGDGLFVYEDCSERCYPERHAAGLSTHVLSTRHLSQYHPHHGLADAYTPDVSINAAGTRNLKNFCGKANGVSTHHGFTAGDVPFNKRRHLIKKIAHSLRELWVKHILPQILADDRVH